MRRNPALDPEIPVGDAVDAIETVIVPRACDLGGFEVRRALPSAARQMVGPRHIWWNFAALSKERIEAAKEAWRAGNWAHGRFRLPPGDDAEFIPAPER